MRKEKRIIELLLRDTGITLNGCNPYDPQINNKNFYSCVLRRGSLGLGESYMAGWWDCESLDQFFHKIFVAEIEMKIQRSMQIVSNFAFYSMLNSGRRSKAFEIGERHYDARNNLYRAMLGEQLNYTCGYWKNAKTLESAQQGKLDLICRKIGLKKGQKILDVGSGWGAFMGYAAKKYGAHAVGVTVSKEQKELADKLYMDYSVETRFQDYRDINEKFDHIVSLGMFEHVGQKNYRTYMKVIHNSLQDDGLFLLHTIGRNHSKISTDPWIEKYIFPNSILPSIKQIGKSIEGLFVMEDWHNFGADYDKTLMAWHRNFINNWDSIKQNYDERFYRMWNYYLLCCAGSFRARKNQLWQIVLSKKGIQGGYKSIR